MQESKYDPLQGFLASRLTHELPMAFNEVERILGFELPPSARRHPAWWSNNRGTNVAVKAWRDAGWRTSKVDVPGERVTFVKDETAGAPLQSGGSAKHDQVSISLEGLTKAARDHLASVQEDYGLDLEKAVAAVLNTAGRRALIDWFEANAPKTTSNSVDLIREDRDGR